MNNIVIKMKTTQIMTTPMMTTTTMTMMMTTRMMTTSMMMTTTVRLSKLKASSLILSCGSRPTGSSTLQLLRANKSFSLGKTYNKITFLGPWT